MSQTEQAPFPLAELAMEFLLSRPASPEPIQLAPQGPEALRVGVEALFNSGAPAQPALSELLGLAHVLSTERKSPTAAARIKDAIRNNPKAMTALGLCRVDAAIASRRSSRVTGAIASARAPVFGTRAPKGTFSVSKVVNPLSLDCARLGRAALEKNVGPPKRR